MRKITLAIILMVFAQFAIAQVTNLKIQNSTSNFTFVSGSTFGWEYNVPPGDTTVCEIWIDVNANGTIEPSTDHIYLAFLQADGVMDGLNGPPDLDATSGHVAFQSPLGIAPGTYVMKFTDHDVSMQVPGTCTPLPSPAYTVSGKVTVPNGQSAQYIPLELSRDKNVEPNFWHAITNANGDYVINMGSDTAGGQWHLKIMGNPISGGVVTPEEHWLYPGLNPTGRDFTIQAPVAKIAGVVVNETGGILPDFQVWLMRNDGGVNRSVSTGFDGSYQIGPLGTELNGQSWFIQAGNGDPMSNSAMMAMRQLPALQGGDSLYKRLVIYSKNSQIQGQVRVNGGPPGFSVEIGASNQDTAQTSTLADAGTGNFTIGVSDKIYNYQVFAFNLGQNYGQSQVVAHPGNTGITVNLTTTSVDEPASAVPQHFALEQNYPNPFNPTTVIKYAVAGARGQGSEIGKTRLEVFNLLGQRVATLVNEVKQPGTYAVQFDASQLPSGFYFYKMTAGSFSSTRSMIVLK